jgi:hypothetical protein
MALKKKQPSQSKSPERQDAEDFSEMMPYERAKIIRMPIA